MPTWETGTDWDSAQSESGVVHESTANTDHTDASELKRGYSVENIAVSNGLIAYYPLHENSGSTAYDVSGNGYDGTTSSVTKGATGILGNSAYQTSHDSSLDCGDVWPFNDSAPVSYTTWAYLDSINSERLLVGNAGARRNLFLRSDGEIAWNAYDGGNQDVNSGDILPTGEWHFIAVTFDGSTVEFYLDASSIGSGSSAYLEGSYEDGIGNIRQGAIDGRQTEVRVYDRALSSSEIQTLYDVVATSGSLTTDKRVL